MPLEPSPKPLSLDYCPPAPKVSRAIRLVPIGVAVFAFCGMIAVLGMIPTTNIWYIGPHNSRVIAVEQGVLEYGPTDHPQSYGPLPVLAAVALVTVGPAWIVNRLLVRLLTPPRHNQPMQRTGRAG